MEPSLDESPGARKTLIGLTSEVRTERQGRRMAAARVAGALFLQVVGFAFGLFGMLISVRYYDPSLFPWPLYIGGFVLVQLLVYAGLRVKFPSAARPFGTAALIFWPVLVIGVIVLWVIFDGVMIAAGHEC